MKYWIYLIVLLFGFDVGLQSMRSSWGSACCARSSVNPSLILGDEQSQLGVGLSWLGTVADTLEDGTATFHSAESTDQRQVMRLYGATLLSDRWQMGVGVSVVRRRVMQGNSDEAFTGLGDSQVGIGYEVLPSWTYSVWRPRGWIFLGLTIPSGRSMYERESFGSADVMGNGFWTPSVGVVLLKRWTLWDIYWMPEVHYSFSRTFDSQGSLPVQEVVPGWGSSMGFGGGYSPGGDRLRLGLRIQPRIDQAKKISINGRQVGSSSAFVTNCDVGLDASFLVTPQATVMLSYTDQTLLGPAANSALNRMFGVNMQYRWER